MKTKSVQKCSTSQSFTLPKWHSFKIGTLEVKLKWKLKWLITIIWLAISLYLKKDTSKNCRTSLSKMSCLFCHFRPGSPWNKRPIQTGSKQDLYTLTLSRPFASGWIMYQFVHIRGASCRCTQSKNEHNKSKHFYSKPISTLWKIAFRMSACNNYIALLQLTIYLKCCLLIQFLIIQHTYYI